MKTIYCPMGADLINHGHINILQTAKTYGKVIVGLFSDKILSNYERIPINTFENRKNVLESISYVDEIVEQHSLDCSDNIKS